jgi:CxxC motif-containing protein (DUF1111 family)
LALLEQAKEKDMLPAAQPDSKKNHGLHHSRAPAKDKQKKSTCFQPPGPGAQKKLPQMRQLF